MNSTKTGLRNADTDTDSTNNIESAKSGPIDGTGGFMVGRLLRTGTDIQVKYCIAASSSWQWSYLLAFFQKYIPTFSMKGQLTKNERFRGKVGQSVRLTRERSPVRIWPKAFCLDSYLFSDFFNIFACNLNL